MYAAAVHASADAVPFADACFSTVLANSSLEHFDQLEAVLREARRVLAPGGHLVLTVHTDRFAERPWFWPRLLRACGLGHAVELYRRRRFRRLAMNNLHSHADWCKLLVGAGFAVSQAQPYMGIEADRVFERELVLARLGVWKFHLSAVARVLQWVLDRLGSSVLRSAVGNWHSRRLGPAYAASLAAEGTALFIVARAVDWVTDGK